MDLPLPWQYSMSQHSLGREQNIYLILSAKSLLLLLSVCKQLGSVPATFPHHPQLAVHTLAADNAAAKCSQPLIRPTAMPFLPHKEHVQQVKEWLLQNFSASTFSTTRNPLPVMENELHHIHLAPKAILHACHIPVSVLKHWRDEVKAQLKDVRWGIIKPILAGEPTEWCSHKVVVTKNSSQP